MKGGIDFKIQGKIDVKGAAAAGKQARKLALQRGAEFLLQVANKDVPYDVGDLEGGGTATSNDEMGIVSYAAPYARRLHEHPEYNFQNGRRGKWLESALVSNRNRIRDLMAASIRGKF